MLTLAWWMQQGGFGKPEYVCKLGSPSRMERGKFRVDHDRRAVVNHGNTQKTWNCMSGVHKNVRSIHDEQIRVALAIVLSSWAYYLHPS